MPVVSDSTTTEQKAPEESLLPVADDTVDKVANTNKDLSPPVLPIISPTSHSHEQTVTSLVVDDDSVQSHFDNSESKGVTDGTAAVLPDSQAKGISNNILTCIIYIS